VLRGGTRPLAQPDAEIEVVHTILDTRAPSADLMASIKKKDRWTIRQSLKGTAKLIEGGGDRLEAFYRLYAAHQHRLGTPAPGAGLFRSLFRNLGERIKMFCLVEDDELLAAMICVASGSGWSSEYVALQQRHQEKDLGYLLYWRVIEWMSEHRVPKFDLGRSTPGSGVHQFKQKWGGTNDFRRYILYGPQAASRAKKIGALRHGATREQRLWAAMPGGVARIAGPYLRRSDPIG
jgi:lipid II:glycine glycyltransferase (peptidoglycan interpeptide bridge formation enzyme)